MIFGRIKPEIDPFSFTIELIQKIGKNISCHRNLDFQLFTPIYSSIYNVNKYNGYLVSISRFTS